MITHVKRNAVANKTSNNSIVSVDEGVVLFGVEVNQEGGNGILENKLACITCKLELLTKAENLNFSTLV